MNGISLENLRHLLNAPVPPLIIDVRSEDACTPLKGAIPNAIRRDPGAAATWALDLDLARKVIVYCAHGEERSQGIAKVFVRVRNTRAISGRRLRGLERRRWCNCRNSGPAIVWVTRERPKIDRIACPWLIRRFIDPDARFIYVPAHCVLDVASGNWRDSL